MVVLSVWGRSVPFYGTALKNFQGHKAKIGFVLRPKPLNKKYKISNSKK